MSNFKDNLEKMYRLIWWNEDLESLEGENRFNESVELFKDLLSHNWIRELLDRKGEVTIIDICSGTGLGGLAFSKVLIDSGYKVSLALNDLRHSALIKGEKYARKLLNIKVELIEEDSRKLYKLSNKYDIALIYGLSTPHFNPYQLISLISSISQILHGDGILIIEEYDRLYSIFLTVGYKYLLPEYLNKDKVLFSIHKKYDPIKGTFKRLLIDILSKERLFMDFRLWDLSSVAGILWVFFKDVDFYNISKRVHGFLLGRGSRYIDPAYYSLQPKIVER